MICIHPRDCKQYLDVLHSCGGNSCALISALCISCYSVLLSDLDRIWQTAQSTSKWPASRVLRKVLKSLFAWNSSWNCGMGFCSNYDIIEFWWNLLTCCFFSLRLDNHNKQHEDFAFCPLFGARFLNICHSHVCFKQKWRKMKFHTLELVLYLINRYSCIIKGIESLNYGHWMNFFPTSILCKTCV
jgi:hypothetical protein